MKAGEIKFMKLPPKLYHWFIRPKWLAKLYISNVIKRNFSLTDKAVLDFGCGTGSNCLMFNPDNYLGVDINSKRIEYARNLYPEYHFQVLEGNSLNIINDSFDYILIVAVLHHIPSENLSDILQEFHRILKPNGKILVIEPCIFSNSHFNNYFMKLFDNGEHIRTINDYSKIFEEQYYEVNIIEKFKKLFFYNELFFTAAKN